jgi:hypothetical protein
MTARLVLLVGGDAGVHSSCEAAARPVALIRASSVVLAADFVRTMRPLVVRAAPEVSSEELDDLRHMAAVDGIAVLAVPNDTDATLGPALHEAVRHRLSTSVDIGADAPSVSSLDDSRRGL